VGIRAARVMYFRKTAEDPVGVSEVRLRGLKDPPLWFDTRSFPPPGMYPEDAPFLLDLLPLVFQNETLGYVAFEADDLRPLATVALQLASAIKRVELHGRVLELSLMDGLTGVYNRRYLGIFLGKEVERSRRYGRNLAVLMIDIDRFKDYNDRFGHLAGDEALRIVTKAIGTGARRGLDVVTRYGGEEFAVVLPETDAAGARIVAEEILRLIRAEEFRDKLTVSVGIASLHAKELRGRELIRRADRALYRAKDLGRDRAVEFEDGMAAYAHPEEADEEPKDPGKENPPRDS
jgi:diguanylate cyclase (GGDEF)-like protein